MPTVLSEQTTPFTATPDPPLMAPEKPPLLAALENLGMRAAGRIGRVLDLAWGPRSSGRLGILTYHRIAPRAAGVPFPSHNVEPARFRQQILGLLQRGFHVCPLREALEISSRGDAFPDRTVVLTFDDGFQSVYTHAWPFLRDHEVPFTIFVNTAYLDTGQPFPFDAWAMRYRDRLPPESYLPLTVAQCREMAEPRLATIGAHTHTHADFRGRPKEFQIDVQLSVDLVREWFGESPVTFAYPVGSPSRGFAGGALAEAAKNAGVSCGLTTESVLVDPQTDRFHWGRFNAFPWDTAATLLAKLDGWYSWAPQARQRVGLAARSALAGVFRQVP